MRRQPKVGLKQAGGASMLAVAVLAAALASGFTSTPSIIQNGSAWLAKGADLIHFGAGSRRADYRITGSGRPSVTQNGSSAAYRSGDDVFVIDPANLRKISISGSYPDGTIFLGGGEMYIVGGRKVVYVDPVTRGPISTTLLKPPVAAVIDSDGALWAASSADGSLRPVRKGKAGKVEVIARAGHELRMTRASDVVVAFDLTEKTLLVIDEKGKVDRTVSLDDVADEIQVPSAGGKRAWSTTSAGDLVGTPVDGGSSLRVRLAKNLGPPVVNAGRVFVPVRGGGTVFVVDEETGRLVSTARVPKSEDPDDFELLVQDGTVWFNDRSNPDVSGTIGSDGTVSRTKPFDKAELPQETPEPDATVVQPSDVTDVFAPPDAGGAPGPAPGAPGPGPGPTPTGGSGGPAIPGGTTPMTTPETVAAAPGAPTFVDAVAGNREVTVTWGLADPRGSDITSYVVQRVNVDDGTTEDLDQPSDAQSVVVDGLKNGKRYRFQVWAVNGVGPGTPAVSPEVRPSREVPEPATNVDAQVDTASGAVAVSWDEADGNGYTITAYEVMATDPALGTRVSVAQVSGTETSADVGAADVASGTAPLVFGGSYSFTVIATNDAPTPGTAESDPSADVVPLTKPGSPVGVSATSPRSTQVDATWGAPSPLGDQASQISYSVTISPGGQTMETGQTQASFSGLSTGTDYTVSVTAKNRAGDGAAASASARTISNPAISLSGASGGDDRQVSGTASLTSDGGAPSVACSVLLNGTPIQAVNCSGPFTITAPGYGTTYTMTLQADNGLIGTSSGASVRTLFQLATLNRYGNGYDMQLSTGGPYGGYSSDGSIGRIYIQQEAGTDPLFEWAADGSKMGDGKARHFYTADPGETPSSALGWYRAGTIGYVSRGGGAGWNPIARYVKNSDHWYGGGSPYSTYEGTAFFTK